MSRIMIFVVFVLFASVGNLSAQDLNLWTGKGNPISIIREVSHSETTFRVTVYFLTYDQATQMLPIVCPGSLYAACLLGASPTTKPSLLANCTVVPYTNTTVIGDPSVKRIEQWDCAAGMSQCQLAEGWIRDTGGLEIVATGGGGPTTGCTPK